jgi:RNA polymerase sigma factor
MIEEQKNRLIDEMAISAAGDEEILEQFILQEMPYIRACAGKTLSMHINTGSEEELIALEAFVEAVVSYSFEKGSFLSFANLVIRRRIIDNFRKEKKTEKIIPMDPADIIINKDKNDNEYIMKNGNSEEKIADEIAILADSLKKYGFSFSDLVSCSPKAKKTKEACKSAVIYITENDLVFYEMSNSRQLPLKIIEKNTGVPRKILERHRKYIIAVAEILKGKYPCLIPYVISMKRR